MPLRISLVLSLVLHLALYVVADWAGFRASPHPPPRKAIEAMLILPEIKAPVPQPQKEPVLPESPAPPVAEAPAQAESRQSGASQPSVAAAPPSAFYPPEAVLRGLEGDVEVGVRLDAAGNVIAVHLERGSGHAILDQAALRAVRTLKSLPSGDREATLPVRFRLR